MLWLVGRDGDCCEELVVVWGGGCPGLSPDLLVHAMDGLDPLGSSLCWLASGWVVGGGGASMALCVGVVQVSSLPSSKNGDLDVCAQLGESCALTKANDNDAMGAANLFKASLYVVFATHFMTLGEPWFQVHQKQMMALQSASQPFMKASSRYQLGCHVG